MFTTKPRGFLLILICETSQIFVWRNKAFIFFQKSDILTALLFHRKWLDWNLIRHNFSIWARSPAPLQTMIEKNKTMILLHFDLCFGGEGGMPGLSHALVPAQESKRWSFGRLLLLPVIQKGLFWARKSQEK